MCRFVLFVGRDPILIADLLTRPAHSIINQSFDCRLRLDLQRPLNGDGFGVGWYPPDNDSLNSGGKDDILENHFKLADLHRAWLHDPSVPLDGRDGFY